MAALIQITVCGAGMDGLSAACLIWSSPDPGGDGIRCLLLSAMVKIRPLAGNIAPIKLCLWGNRAAYITVMHHTFSKWMPLSFWLGISTVARGGIA